MIILDIHTSYDGKKVVALCDSSLIGKRIEEEKKQLDCSSKFYQGKEATKEEILRESDVDVFYVNAVGKESITFCVQQKWVDEDDVGYVDKVPYANVMVVNG